MKIKQKKQGISWPNKISYHQLLSRKMQIAKMLHYHKRFWYCIYRNSHNISLSRFCSPIELFRENHYNRIVSYLDNNHMLLLFTSTPISLCSSDKRIDNKDIYLATNWQSVQRILQITWKETLASGQRISDQFMTA